ncbi:hypothetical protein [Aeromicrobium fastidiosum]|uniref:hypothetical protein n=1 Tax=Aeromicrobium fastidiosum TaxID=52699 RepID=UPI00100FFB5D|nr:hypothetical protein [Aeromicrobium fastidiosum]
MRQEFGSEQAIYYGLDRRAGIAFGSISKLDGESGLAPRDAFITDLKTKEMVRISNGRTRPDPTQFTSMTFSNGHLVWVETDSDNLSASNWVMYAYELGPGGQIRGGHTVELARAPDVGVKPVPMAAGSTVPRISGSEVYFAAVSAVRKNKNETSAYRVPLDGSSKMSLFERDVDGVFADDDWVYFGRGDDLLRRSVRAGSKAEPVAAMDSIRSFCGGAFAHGMFVACSNRARTQNLKIFDTKDNLIADIDVGENSISASTLDITSDLVAFDIVSGMGSRIHRYVFDVHSGRLSLLSKKNVNTIASGSGRIQQLRVQPEKGIAESFEFVEILA